MAGIDVTASLSDTIIASGGTIKIRVAAHNVLGESRALLGSTGCVASRDVRSPTGTLLERGPGRVCLMDLRQFAVAAGDSLIDNLTWVAMSRTGSPLDPGTYTVRAIVVTKDAGEVLSIPYRVHVH